MIYPTRRRFHVIAATVGLATAVVATWPVAAHLRDHVIDGARLLNPKNPGDFWAANLGADVLTTVWIVGWVLHALVTQPLHLFEANIFYPAPLSLARCEHMFATSLLGIPGALLDGPVLAHQGALLLTFVLMVWTTAYVVSRWTGSLLGGLAAGVLLGLDPIHILTLLKILGVAYFPLIFFTLERFGVTGAPRWAMLAAAALVLEMLSGQYLAFFALVVWAITVAVVVLAGRPNEHPIRRMARDGAILAGATAVAALLVLPFALPYLRLSAENAFDDNSTSVFLTKFGIHSVWEYVAGHSFYAATPFSPWMLLLLVTGATALALGDRNDRVRLMVLGLAGLAGALLSIGPKPGSFGLYTALAQVLPGFRTLREPHRWAVIPHVSAAMLAGVGVAALVRRLPRAGLPVAVALAASAAIATWRGPVPLRHLPTGDAVPAAYRFLARCGAGDPLLELPATHPSMLDNFRDAERDYFSTFHWLPILNGRSGYQPMLFRRTMQLAWNVPNPDAVAELRRIAGLRWVLVDCAAGPPHPPGMGALCGPEGWPDVTPRVFGTMRLYDLGPVPTLPREWPRRWPARGDCS
jgi:hypothetical protein